MLIEFSLGNIFSFKNEFNFNMIKSSARERNGRLNDNFFNITKKVSLLKTAAVYGANSSGKTNLLKALQYFTILLTTNNLNIETTLFKVVPFNFNSKDPMSFKITTFENDIFYNYSLEIMDGRVISEIFSYIKKSEVIIFKRELNEVVINNSFNKIKQLQKKDMIAEKSLLILLASSHNEQFSIDFIASVNKIKVISGNSDISYKDYTVHCIDQNINKNLISKLLKLADPTIQEVQPNITQENYPLQNKLQENNSVKKYDYFFSRNIFIMDTKSELKVLFPNWLESSGTIKFFHILGPILNTLDLGLTLLIDELDSKLHPNLVTLIIQLFHNPITNPKNAQLIFNTHNAIILSKNIFRRDQIWITEKLSDGSSEIFSLVDFVDTNNRKIRNDESIVRNYLSGKYGGIPNLDIIDIEEVFNEKNN